MEQKVKLERLDKMIAAQTTLSRKDTHRLISRGQVLVNEVPARAADQKINPDADAVSVSGKMLTLRRYSYLMLNKPRGVVCATEDARLPTVLDLVPEQLFRTGLFPAGRLDKDTEGFVLITNDGEFAHRILSPRSHVPKTYTARLDKPFDLEMIAAFEKGVVLDGKPCMPAMLCAVEGDFSVARVVLRQGMYHQVKRMFGVYGCGVEALHRDAIGGLALDPELESGKCRELSEIEVKLLTKEEGERPVG